MLKKELESEYYDWIYTLLCENRCAGRHTYHKLLGYLHSVPFRYVINRDADRLEDGLSLRRRFAYCNDLDEESVVYTLRRNQCSVLEMMVALCMRCEDVMDDPAIGDRTAQWFWQMIITMGLGSMTDIRFDIEAVEAAVEDFLSRKYEPDGRGGLFKIKRCNADLRRIDIWTQMLWYMDSIT